MGTTLTAGTLVAGNTILLGHVGDSRAYLLHDGELRQVTVDHSLVEELVQEGRLTADEAAVHPQRSIITRSIGTDPTVEVDVYPVELSPGDRLLLCSDGLTDMVHIEDIAATLRREEDPTRAAAAAGRRGQPRRRRRQHHRRRGRGHRRGTAARRPRARRAARRHRGRRHPRARARRAPAARSARRRAGCSCGRCPIVLVLGIAVAAVGWYAREGLLRGHQSGTGHGVQGGARRPRGLGSRPSSNAPRSRSTT